MSKLLERLKEQLPQALADHIAKGMVAVGVAIAVYTASAVVDHPVELLRRLHQIPVPLGVSILLALLSFALGLLIGRRIWKPKENPPPKRRYFQTGPFKWLVELHSDGGIRVEEIPYCAQHDHQFFKQSQYHYMCPNSSECGGDLELAQLRAAHSQASSMILTEIRKERGS